MLALVCLEGSASLNIIDVVRLDVGYSLPDCMELSVRATMTSLSLCTSTSCPTSMTFACTVSSELLCF